MVQQFKAYQISERWEAAGQPFCDHPRWERVYDGALPPEMDVCLVCGELKDIGEPNPPPRGKRSD